MKKIHLTIILFLAYGMVSAQESSKEAIGKLSFLVGNWEGEAKAATGPGEIQLINQHESVAVKLGGRMLMIEGKGYQNGDLVFNAIGLVTFDEGNQKYEMQSWLATGETTKAYFEERGDKKFEWGFPLPNGQVRYLISLDEEGRWKEKGEFSPDGNTWYPSFEMLLTKKAD
ncbi:DUF1579 family protein [Cecembia sp.]|uniref:DUF1579 family protein n=1 Tax=Cecembia sp. TaxID=1898110 RepID=UPI0025BEAE8B|nr:DUF1579 family protein [Cecembia sp.]